MDNSARNKILFFLPVYVYLADKMNKGLFLKWTWFLINVIFLFVIEYFGLINRFNDGSYTRPAHEFLTRFTTFFLGSFLAFIIYNVKEMEFYKVYIEKDGYRKIIGIITLLIYMFGIKLSDTLN